MLFHQGWHRFFQAYNPDRMFVPVQDKAMRSLIIVGSKRFAHFGCGHTARHQSTDDLKWGNVLDEIRE